MGPHGPCAGAGAADTVRNVRASLRSARIGPAVTVLLVVVLRLAAAQPVASAAIVAVLAVGAVVIGLVVHGRRHVASWRRAWELLGTGLVVAAAGGLVRAVVGSDAVVGLSALDVFTLAGHGFAGAGLVLLLRERLPGRAFDTVFEGVLVAAVVLFVPWSASAAAGVPTRDLLVLVLPFAQVVVLWLLVRLVALSSDHPVAYRYVGAGMLCLLTVEAVVAGGVLGATSVSRSSVVALHLWGLCLWGAGALHPSLRRRFDPVAARSARLRASELMALLTASLLPAAVFGLQAMRGYGPSLQTALLGATGMPLLVAAYLVRQVHERASAEYRAQHDALTGLPNGVVFHDRVEVALASARRSGRRAAVMFLDLDRFKSINDSLGHAVGDQLLRTVATRLQAVLRDSDTVARLGGDEFTILLSSLDDETDCVRVAEKVLGVFADPIVAGGRELTTSTSIGVAVFPDDGEDVEALLKHADTAMYRAKANGRNAYQLYTSDMSARARVRLSLESNLRTAIDRRELELHYQPKVDLASQAVVGVEALVRWPHRELGFVAPDAFIPLAEETGLIVPLGEWVLEAACTQAKAWIDAGLPPLPVAVNLSARQFADRRFEGVVEGVLDRTGLPASMLELEITESVFLHDLAAATSTLRDLRALGVGCSIDDFGTGYSGLRYLATMPIDSLKIDRSFIGSISGETDESPIVEAVIALAHSLRMTVVAEGVETDRQARFLRAHGCEQMQGYLFSPPVPAHEIESLLLVRDDDIAAAVAVPSARRMVSPRPEVAQLLRAAAENEDLAGVDERLVADVLAALAAGETVVATASPLRSASVRLAAGTFAGLLPLGGGMAAAGTLPMPAHRVASAVFAQVGVEVPPPPAAPAQATGPAVDAPGQVVAPAPGPEPSRPGADPTKPAVADAADRAAPAGNGSENGNGRGPGAGPEHPGPAADAGNGDGNGNDPADRGEAPSPGTTGGGPTDVPTGNGNGDAGGNGNGNGNGPATERMPAVSNPGGASADHAVDVPAEHTNAGGGGAPTAPGRSGR